MRDRRGRTTGRAGYVFLRHVEHVGGRLYSSVRLTMASRLCLEWSSSNDRCSLLRLMRVLVRHTSALPAIIAMELFSRSLSKQSPGRMGWECSQINLGDVCVSLSLWLSPLLRKQGYLP